MGKVSNVNTTDIADAIRLGCRTTQSVFNADDGDVPFFMSRVRPCPYRKLHPPENAGRLALDEAAVPCSARPARLS